MKRVLSLLLAMIMVLGMLPVSAFAAGGPARIYFEVSGLKELQKERTENPEFSVIGKRFTVSAYLKNNPGIASFTNTLRWNHNVLRFVEFEKSDGDFDSEVLWSKGWSSEVNDTDAIVGGMNTKNSSKNGHLYTAVFEFIAENGELGLGLQTEQFESGTEPFIFNNIETNLTAKDYVIDDSAIAGQSIGVIPYGAPFSAVYTYDKDGENLGSALDVAFVENYDIAPWGDGAQSYETPHYHITAPAGTTELRVRFYQPHTYFMEQTENDVAGIGSAYISVNADEIESGMAHLHFGEHNEKFTDVIIPMNFSPAMGTEAKSLSALKTDKAVYYAVGPEDSAAAPIAVFTFEHEQAETYEIAIDETMVGGTLTAKNESNETITEASAGEAVYVTIIPDEGYKGNSYTINGETANDVVFQMPEKKVILSATFDKLSYKIKGTGKVEGGTVTAKIGDTAVPEAGCAWGETVTVDAAPDKDYQLTALTYKAGNGESVDILKSKSFEMPKDEVTITATFTEEQNSEFVPPEGAPFGNITTDKGAAISAEKLDRLTVNVWGLELKEGDWYHIVVPAGTTQAQVTLNTPSTGLSRGIDTTTGEYNVSGIFGNVVYDVENSAEIGCNAAGTSFDFTSEGNTTVITVPMTIENGLSLVKPADYDENIDESGDYYGPVYYAVAPKYGDQSVVCFFTFEYGEAGSQCDHANVVDDGNCETAVVCTCGVTVKEAMTHAYTKQTVSQDALKTEATCSAKAAYYYSCANDDCTVINKGKNAATFESGEVAQHSIENSKCKWCDALDAYELKWWYGTNAVEIMEISIQEGEEVDISAGCSPKAVGVISVASADSDIASVNNENPTTNTNGHAALKLTGHETGETTVTAASKIHPERKAELKVTVTCGHTNTENRTTSYAQLEGKEFHTVTVTCTDCSSDVTTSTVECTDGDNDGKCDLCEGAVAKNPASAGPYLIYDSSIHGEWGTISMTHLYVDGVIVKGYEWVNGSCVVTLDKDTDPDATMTFTCKGLSGGAPYSQALYINNNKTAPLTAQLQNGAATVAVKTASKNDSNSQATTKNIVFKLEGSATIRVQSITITPEDPVVKAGGNLQLSATVYPENATIKDVIWSTTAASTNITLNETGKVTGQTMGMGNKYTVTATSVSNPEVKATTQVYLDWKTETGISLDKNTLSLKSGEAAKLTATVTGENFVTNTTVTWSTDDADIAAVDQQGNVTAGTKTGTTTITATSYSGLTAQCTVTVEAAHTCVYDQQEAEAKYLKKEATCESAAVYYKSCTCGEVDKSEAAEIFTSGTVVPHNYATEDGTCRWCGQSNPLGDIKINLGDGETLLNGTQLNLTSGENMILDLSFENPAAVKDLITWTSDNPDVAQVTYSVSQNAFELVSGTAGEATISLYDSNDVAATAADEENQTPTPLATFTVTVEDAPIQVDGYSIIMDADKPSQMVGEENIAISLEVNHNSLEANHNKLTVYNSYKLKLTYDPAVLLLTTATDESKNINVSDTEGTVVITRYGSALTTGTNDIVLNFKAVAPGVAEVKLTEAYISDSDAALTQNAVAASIIDNNAVVEVGTTVITVAGFDVDLSADFSSEQTVLKPGEALKFTSNIEPFYEYTVIVEVQNSEGEWITLPAEALSGSGTEAEPYTVAASYIDGNIRVSSSTPIGKTYNVTITNPTEDPNAMAPAQGYETGDDKAQYKSEAGYKADFNPTKTELYEYSVSVTVGGAPYTCTPEGGVYTIPGDDIKGDIKFEVTVSPKQVAPHTVTITGSGEEDVVKETAAQTVANGENYTFNLMMAEGYDYTVTATMGGTGVDVDKAETANVDGSFTYTIKNVTAALKIVIEKSNLMVEISEYLDLNEKTMFLITATKTLNQGQSLSYQGHTMFYSAQYGAWAYLVIVNEGEALDAAVAKADITVGTTNFTTIPITMDVNKSNAVDINDAQLVYDMYSAKKYTNLTQPEIMEKLLRADTAQGESAKKLEVNDARAVVAYILSLDQSGNTES